MEDEIWKDVVGYEGMYQVSNMGRVLSIERDTTRICSTRKDSVFHVKGGYVYMHDNQHGYVVCNLSKDKKSKSFSVHRLVAIAFIPNPNGYREVNHIDGNKLNNRSDNLEWCTRQQNIRHSFDMGLNHGFLGTDHSKCRFTEQDVYAIREMWDNKMKSRAIAEKYECSISAIEHIGRRRLWKHLIEI